MSKIASRPLGWPEHVAFIVAHEGIGTGLAGSGEGVGLGDGVGVGVATSEGVGLGVIAVPGEPHPVSAKTTPSAPTENLTRDWNGDMLPDVTRAPNMKSLSEVIAAPQDTASQA